MGSYDGAESCELVGSFLLHNITQKYCNNFGLYRDDGLGIIKGSPRQVELTKKDLCAIFNEQGLKITIEANKKCVNFLDTTLNLSTGKHMPYTKPNNTPLYIHTKSNHPPTIIKNLPESINKRLSDISSDKESFDRAATPYTSEPLTTVGTTTNSIFGLQHPEIYTIAKRKDDIEILPGTIHPIAKASLPISAELSSRS